jgi:hypothetical protein
VVLKYCGQNRHIRTPADETAELLGKAFRKIEDQLGPVSPENYASYKPTLNALASSKGSMSAKQVSAITGRKFFIEAIALSNLHEAKLLKKTRRGFQNKYSIKSLEEVSQFFSVGSG